MQSPAVPCSPGWGEQQCYCRAPTKPQGLGDMAGVLAPQGGTAWLPRGEELPAGPWSVPLARSRINPWFPAPAAPVPTKQSKALCPGCPGTGRDCLRPLPQPLRGADPHPPPTVKCGFTDVQLAPQRTLILTCHTTGATGRDPAARSSLDMALDIFDALVNKLPVPVEELAAQFAAYRLTGPWKYFCSLCCCWGELRDVCLL